MNNHLPTPGKPSARQVLATAANLHLPSTPGGLVDRLDLSSSASPASAGSVSSIVSQRRKSTIAWCNDYFQKDSRMTHKELVERHDIGKIIYHCTSNVMPTLDLSNFTHITSLPSGLGVISNLKLTGCKALTCLPPTLNVRGNLTLTDCIALHSLPQTLQVSGNVYLHNCISLQELPGSLISAQQIVGIETCISLANLPDDLIANLLLQGFKPLQLPLQHRQRLLEQSNINPNWLK